MAMFVVLCWSLHFSAALFAGAWPKALQGFISSVFMQLVIVGDFLFTFVGLVATTLCHEHKGSRIALEEAKATPRVDVAETPPASPFLEAHGKQFHRPGPSSVSPQSFLVRALTGQTLVVRWSSLDTVLHCVSERTGVPLHAFHLTLNGKCLTVIVPLPFLWSWPAPWRFFLGAGDWVRSRCHINGCWPTKSRCDRCGAPRNSAPQDAGPSLLRSPTFREPRIVPPKRGGAPLASSASSPETSTSQLDPRCFEAWGFRKIC